MMVDDGKMLIDTPLGTLVAYASDDDERPGIFIDLRRPGFGVDAPLTFVEYEPPENNTPQRLVTRVWGDANFDDATDVIEHSGLPLFFMCRGSGGEYVEYPPKGDEEREEP